MKILRRAPSITALAVAIAIARATIAAQSDPSLAEVLERLGAYLTSYSEQLSRTVSDERYKQTSGTGNTYSEALLESEFGILKVPDYPGWLGFRDVLKVNGRAVQNHESRLQDLLLNPAPFPVAQARRIAAESARQNIGALQRNINNPALVLELFDRRNHSSFQFTKAADDTIDSTRVWVIRYEELVKPTIIKTPQGLDVPTAGQVWVDPTSGALIRAEVNVNAFFAAVGFGASKAQLRVYFKEDPRLKFWVPVRMTERYDVGGLGPLTGDATYSNYRQFGTETHEEFGPVK
ncbi:MAG TPA: hypothetical protein VGZ27_00020 [Vicinamibacterales bacterium]|nr:hypothetical protein [Vicinamibacterales bacterium]